MTSLISWPFRLDASGAVAARDDADEDYLAEELAQLIQTQPGERELAPTYGLNDPAFAEFSTAELVAAIHVFGPPVIIETVTTRWLSESHQDVVVAFHAAPTAQQYDLVGTELTGDEEITYADS